MPQYLFSFTSEDRRVLLSLIVTLFLLSFAIQVAGLSSSVWLCEENSSCKGISEIGGVIRGLVITGFILKCIVLTAGVVIVLYRYCGDRNPSTVWLYCRFDCECVFKALPIFLAISEILSGSTFFVASIQYQSSISWSIYLYAFFSAFLVIAASVVLVIRVLLILLHGPCFSNTNDSQALERSDRQPTPNTQTRTDLPNISYQVQQRPVTGRSIAGECGICMERRVDVILPCNHNICRSCALRIQRESRSLCPFCRTYFSGVDTMHWRENAA